MGHTPDDPLAAIAAGRCDRVHDHLARGGSPQAVFECTSLLRWCAHHGDVSALRLLLAQGCELADLGPNLDLNGAAFHGHWQLAEFLLEHGADARYADPDSGETALHLALSRANRPRRLRIVRALLAAGADANARTRADAQTGVFMRDSRCRGETPLHRAAAFADAASIEALLAAGAAREARDAHGDSPLAWASWHLRPAPVLRLLCFGPYRLHADNDSSYDHGQDWQLSER